MPQHNRVSLDQIETCAHSEGLPFSIITQAELCRCAEPGIREFLPITGKMVGRFLCGQRHGMREVKVNVNPDRDGSFMNILHQDVVGLTRTTFLDKLLVMTSSMQDGLFQRAERSRNDPGLAPAHLMPSGPAGPSCRVRRSSLPRQVRSSAMT
jgi:hypothetical protein